eukprot:c16675_g1_i1 orf=540-893(+)
MVLLTSTIVDSMHRQCSITISKISYTPLPLTNHVRRSTIDVASVTLPSRPLGFLCLLLSLAICLKTLLTAALLLLTNQPHFVSTTTTNTPLAFLVHTPSLKFIRPITEIPLHPRDHI